MIRKVDNEKAFKNTLLILVVYLIVMQLFMYKLVNKDLVYSNRMDYDLIKDRPSNIHVVLESVKREIKERKLDDYIVIVGDSVGYSSPGKSNQSIGYYMEEIYQENNQKIGVFNLSLPSNQTGDIYTILLLMDEYGISRQHIIINVIYAGFIERNPSPPLVFWFNNDFKKLDAESFAHVKQSQILNGKYEEPTIKSQYNQMKKYAYGHFALTRYKDFVVADFKRKFGNYESTWMNETGEPWTNKPFLRELLNDPLYQAGFTDQPFVMTEENLQIYFLNRIFEIQKDKDLLVFMSGVNTVLLETETQKQGYHDNLDRLNNYFTEQEVHFVNLFGQMDNDLYSDQIHFIPKGYKELANILYEETVNWLD